MPTDIIESIGDGQDYANVNAWKVAHDGEDLVTQDVRYIGEFYTGTHSDNTAVFFDANTAGTVTDATRYRWLRPAAGHGYNPVNDTGAKIVRTDTAATTIVFRSREAFFRLGMAGRLFGMFNLGIQAGAKRIVRVDQSGNVVDSIYAFMTGGNSTENACFHFPGNGAGWLVNCIARSTTSDGGAFYGFRVNQPTATLRVYNCLAHNIQFDITPFQGIGFSLGALTDCRNCISIGSGLLDYQLVATPAVFTHCGSEDATATGTGALTGLSAGSVWGRPASFDYHLHVPDASVPDGSPCIDVGIDLESNWYSGASPLDIDGIDHGAGDLSLWDMGPYAFLTVGRGIHSDSRLDYRALGEPALASSLGLSPARQEPRDLAPAVQDQASPPSYSRASQGFPRAVLQSSEPHGGRFSFSSLKPSAMGAGAEPERVEYEARVSIQGALELGPDRAAHGESPRAVAASSTVYNPR